VISPLYDVLLIFSFQFGSAFLPCRSARRHRGVLGLPNNGHRTFLKIWVGFLYEAYRQGNDFELILAVKWKLRQRDHLVVNIRRSVIIALLWRKTWKCCEKLLRFFSEKRPFTLKFKIQFLKFSSRHRSTLLLFNFCKIWPTGN